MGKISHPTNTSPVTSIRVLSLNCWGLKGISKLRPERLSEIGNRLATYNPPLDIVGLQEVWCFSDFKTIRDKVKQALPHGKFYHSGVFGAGLAIFSRWPIEESSMHPYILNGRPTAFFRGDWFVGKGVASAMIQMPDGQPLEVFCTHLHAPYEKEPNDSYICHRTSQAWDIAKLMRNAQQRGSLVLGMGDFNMIPMSFAHVLVESRGNVKDVWRLVNPDSSVGASIDKPEVERRRKMGEKECPTIHESLYEHGHTCDNATNTWRWSKSYQKDLRNGKIPTIKDTDPDRLSKRLDYIFLGGLDRGWMVESATVVMTEPHPSLLCSLSDHFGIHATIVHSKSPAETQIVAVQSIMRHPDETHPETDNVDITGTDAKKIAARRLTDYNLTPQFYQDILDMIESYKLRERKQRRWRVTHWLAWVTITIACWIAIWWSPHNYVAFILNLVSTLGLMYGTVDGLIGGLFMGSELRALAEFEWEVRNAYRKIGGSIGVDVEMRDWYD